MKERILRHLYWGNRAVKYGEKSHFTRYRLVVG